MAPPTPSFDGTDDDDDDNILTDCCPDPVVFTSDEKNVSFKRYDLNAKGYLTQQEFLQKMNVESAPDTSLHRPFIAENSTRFMEGYKKAEQKHIDVNEIIIKIR